MPHVTLRLLLCQAIVLLLTLPSYAFADVRIDEQTHSPIAVPNPATDLWRAVRQREAPASGNTQVAGVESGVLINRGGETFRQYRRQDFIGNAGLFIGAVAALVLLFYLIRGRIGIEGGRSGEKIQRFRDYDRTLHWLIAGLFVFLGLTGLTLLFGRFVILPVLGPEAFSVIASACKEGHNLFGPLFLVALILLFIRFVKKNLPARGDLHWIVTGGGIIGSKHASAGYFNAGEKIWFWSVVFLGLVVSASGLVLVFPVFGQAREVMQIALVVHGIAAVLFIGGSFGHIYIGTLGTEGSLESMTTGYVDANWARAHHDRWYQDVTGRPVAAGDETDTDTRPQEALRASPDKA